MNLPDLNQLEKIVKPAAQEILVPGFGVAEYTYKDDGSVITAADMEMQHRLEIELKNAWPEFALLGEEMEADEQQAVLNSKQGYWCVDPLDGTSNYATGLPFFAVSIALVINCEVVLGFIYDPLRDEVFAAIKSQGATLNGKLLMGVTQPTPSNRVIAEIDMKRLPKELAVRLVTEEPFSSQRNIGSSALDWCWLAANRYNVYLHGGQKLWDYAAGSRILAEAGGTSISLDGDSVFRGKLEIRSALASLDINLFEKWRKWVGIT